MAVNLEVRELQIAPPPSTAGQARKDFIGMRVGHLHPPRCAFHCEPSVNPRPVRKPRPRPRSEPPQPAAGTLHREDSADCMPARRMAVALVSSPGWARSGCSGGRNLGASCRSVSNNCEDTSIKRPSPGCPSRRRNCFQHQPRHVDMQLESTRTRLSTAQGKVAHPSGPPGAARCKHQRGGRAAVPICNAHSAMMYSPGSAVDIPREPFR